MKHPLREEKLNETVIRIQGRIDEQFPASGLSIVAGEIVLLTQKAVKRARHIGRPILWLRISLFLLPVIGLVGAYVYLQNNPDQMPPLQTVFRFLDAAKGSAAFLAAVALFLITLETRIKRYRALRAVHELRGMAHLIDMYQLAKAPDQLGLGGKRLPAEDMAHYLHDCTELLAIVGKLGQLYVQDFFDAQAQSAVDQFENLVTGLSSKIWQKLMILDRIRSELGPTATDCVPAGNVANREGK